MVKQSKRTRKFISSGGVKGRLQKGTILKKGKARKGNKRGKGDDGDAALKKAMNSSYSAELRKKKEDSDFVSEKNLGELDMESFFTSAAEGDDAPDDVDEVSDEGASDSDDDDESDADDDRAGSSPSKKQKIAGSKGEIEESESSSSDSDEDVDEAERRMKEELGKLDKNDPEFHEFLKENDESLLAFGETMPEQEIDDDDEDELMEVRPDEPIDDAEPEVDTKAKHLDSKLLSSMEKGVFQMHGIKVLKKFVNAFKSACHLSDTEEGESKDAKKYQIDSSQVFDRLMVLSLTRLSGEFHYHLLGKGSKAKSSSKKNKSKAPEDDEAEEEFVVDPNKPINPKMLEKSERWSQVKPILFTFLKAMVHVLSEAKEPELVVFVLKSLADYVPYMTPFPRLAESTLKTLTGLWSAPIDASDDYQVVRLHAFLRVRQLAMTQPFPYIEDCLKKLYLAYAQRAKFATASSVTSGLPTLTFMGNCVVELYSLDYHSSYQHAFIYIRQLALHLRTAMQKKTSEAMGAVYCWQYLHCLKLWVAVLTEACQSESAGSSGEDQLLRSLLFPLSQVIIGTVRLIPSARYLPLRLHCVRLLQQLAAAAEIFLPTTSILLDVFDLRELSQAPKKTNKGSTQPLALTLRLRADSPLRTMDEMEMCVSEVFVLLNREVDLYQYSAGFPEFAVRISQRLRKVSCCIVHFVGVFDLSSSLTSHCPLF